MSQHDVTSPCVRACCLNEDDVCMGCYRHIEEIIQWAAAPLSTKEVIMMRVAERRLKQSNPQK